MSPTKIEKVRGASSKAKYVAADGEWLPGTTTICDLLGPVGGLAFWGFNIGRSGEVDDYWAYMKGLASAGSCAHKIIEAYLLGVTADLSMFTGQEIAIGESCLEKFKVWANGKSIEPLDSERALVSEKFRYGGQFDLYLDIDGKKTILDLKSSSAVRDSMLVQVAAYRQLAEENDMPVEQVGVIALGRDPEDPLRSKFLTDTAPQFEMFKHLLDIHRIQVSLAKAKKAA